MSEQVVEFIGGPSDGHKLPFADFFDLYPEVHVATQIGENRYREARYELLCMELPTGKVGFRYCHTGNRNPATAKTRRRRK